MDKFTLGIIAFPILFSMLALRTPIGLAMLIVGCSGTILIAGWLPILSQVKTSAWHLFSNYSLSVIPLFLLMGNFAGKAGMSEALFKFTGACLGHRKGGVAMAAIGACAGFGAICGSSLATAATMGKVALPELRKMGYSNALSTGALAAGGTLGILIPPSVILIIYSILTEQNIAKMFLAAFIPGFLAAVGYITAIAIYVRFFPNSGPNKNRVDFKSRFSLFKNIWHVLLIFFIVTATFIKLPGPTVSKIDTITEDPYKKVTILVAVTEIDEFWIDKKRVEESALKLNLTRMFNENPKSGMVIQADNESSIESLAKVADIARDVGISPVAISVEND